MGEHNWCSAGTKEPSSHKDSFRLPVLFKGPLLYTTRSLLSPWSVSVDFYTKHPLVHHLSLQAFIRFPPPFSNYPSLGLSQTCSCSMRIWSTITCSLPAVVALTNWSACCTSLARDTRSMGSWWRLTARALTSWLPMEASEGTVCAVEMRTSERRRSERGMRPLQLTL